MTDSQVQLPHVFVALHTLPGQRKPGLSWAALVLRHELCEDMAQMLVEHASQVLVRLGIAESDVLTRVLAGLNADEGRLSELESRWVVCRLAELLHWPVPASLAAGLPLEAAGAR